MRALHNNNTDIIIQRLEISEGKKSLILVITLKQI